jgi:hypothetical protein
MIAREKEAQRVAKRKKCKKIEKKYTDEIFARH